MASNSVRMKSASGCSPDFGAIFMSNKTTIEECFKRKLFGLPHAFVDFVKEVKAGMVLFLFEYEQRKLHGVFQAITDGTVDIIPHAYCSSGKLFPAQVQFSVIWNCHPLLEHDFRDAIRDNYFAAKKFNFGLSKDQVQSLLCLFYSCKVRVQRSLMKRRCSKSPDELNPLVDSGKLALEKEDSEVENVARNSGGVLQSLNSRTSFFQHSVVSRTGNMFTSVHECATHSSSASASLVFSGSQSVPLQKESEHDISSHTTSSNLGDYIPLSSPEHFDLMETGNAFSKAGNLKDRHGYQTSSVFSPDEVQCDGFYQSCLVSPIKNRLKVKRLYSDTSGNRMSVFSRLNLVSKAAVEKSEDNSEDTESVHDIVAKLQQYYEKWKKGETKSSAHEREDIVLKRRASVFSRLNYASKDDVEEKEVNTQADELTSRTTEIFRGKKIKRGRKVFVRSQDNGENFNLTVQVWMSKNESQVEEDTWAKKPTGECIPLVNFSNKGEVLKNVNCETGGRDCADGGVGERLSAEHKQKKRRLVRPMFRKESDFQSEICNSCLDVQMPPSLESSAAGEENDVISCEGTTRSDKADDSQTGLTQQKHTVPAVICPTSSHDGNGEAQGKSLVKLRESGGARKSWFSTNHPLRQYQRRRLSASPGVKCQAKELCVEERQAECIRTIVGADGEEDAGQARTQVS